MERHSEKGSALQARREEEFRPSCTARPSSTSKHCTSTGPVLAMVSIQACITCFPMHNACTQAPLRSVGCHVHACAHLSAAWAALLDLQRVLQALAVEDVAAAQRRPLRVLLAIQADGAAHNAAHGGPLATWWSSDESVGGSHGAVEACSSLGVVDGVLLGCAQLPAQNFRPHTSNNCKMV